MVRVGAPEEDLRSEEALEQSLPPETSRGRGDVPVLREAVLPYLLHLSGLNRLWVWSGRLVAARKGVIARCELVPPQGAGGSGTGGEGVDVGVRVRSGVRDAGKDQISGVSRLGPRVRRGNTSRHVQRRRLAGEAAV